MTEAEHIEGEIERTRSEMTGTLQEIERKLSPNRLVDEAMESMRKVNLGDSRLMDLARDNPIPLALVGLGIGWLAVSSLRGSSSSLASDVEDYAEDAYAGTVARGVRDAEEWAGYGAGSGGGNGASERLGGMAERARDKMGEMAGTVSERAQQWSDMAQSRAQQMSERMGTWSRSMRNQAGDWAGRTGDLFDSNPLAVGLLALVAGVALGAAIPATRRESEMWGDTSADLIDQARATGRQALQKAGQVVQRAAEAVGESGSQAMQRGKETFKDEARRQDLAGGGTATAH